MDTQISELTREQDPPEPRVRTRVFLPGEAGPRQAPAPQPSVLDGGEPTVTTDPAARFTASPPGRRRNWLLATAGMLVVAGAGGWFLVSPYNTVLYPVDAAPLRTQGQTLASAASAVVADLVAPSAQVARAPQPVPPPPPQRDLVAIPSSDAQMREILALRARTPGESSVADHSSAAPATPSQPIPPAIPQVASSSLPAPPRVASPPPVAAQAATPPVLAKNAADGAGVIPATAPVQQADPLQSPSLPPLAVLETGATPASTPLVTPVVTQAAALTRTAPNITERQASGAVAPAVPPPNADPAVVSASDANPPSGPGTEPAAPIAPLPAPAPNAGPAQPGPATAIATQPVAAAPVSRSLSTPGEVIGATTELRAAPMMPAHQIEVLNLVAKLGVVVRDMRAENAALKSRVESTADRFDAAVTDFERRLALAEAKGALSAAMGALQASTVSATETAGASPTRPARAVPGAGSGVQIIPAANTAAAAGAAAPRYRVTAASPGLAMLSLLDRSGGEGSQLQIAVGDQVPGYGRVTAIQQRGSAWIVQTDKGPDKGVIQ